MIIEVNTHEAYPVPVGKNNIFFTGNWSKTNSEIDREHKLIVKTAIALEKAYKDVLSDNDRANAWKFIWGAGIQPLDYERMFLVNVLMSAYRVFDESHKRYPKILEAIKRNNPEWVSSFEDDHERKLARCKVPIYAIC